MTTSKSGSRIIARRTAPECAAKGATAASERHVVGESSGTADGHVHSRPSPLAVSGPESEPSDSAPLNEIGARRGIKMGLLGYTVLIVAALLVGIVAQLAFKPKTSYDWLLVTLMTGIGAFL